MIKNKDLNLSNLYNKLLSDENLDRLAIKLLEYYARDSRQSYLGENTSFCIYYSDKTKDIEFGNPLVGESRIKTDIRIPRIFYKKDNDKKKLDDKSFVDEFKLVVPFIKSEIMKEISKYSDLVLKMDDVSDSLLVSRGYISTNDLEADCLIKLIKSNNLSNVFIDLNRPDLEYFLIEYFEYLCKSGSRYIINVSDSLNIFKHKVNYIIISNLIDRLSGEAYKNDKYVYRCFFKLIIYIYLDSDFNCPDDITNLILEFINSKHIDMRIPEIKDFLKINNNLVVDSFTNKDHIPIGLDIDVLNINAINLLECLSIDTLIKSLPFIKKVVVYNGDLKNVEHIKDVFNIYKSIIINNKDSIYYKYLDDEEYLENYKCTDDITFQSGYVSGTYNVFKLKKKD